MSGRQQRSQTSDTGATQMDQPQTEHQARANGDANTPDNTYANIPVMPRTRSLGPAADSTGTNPPKRLQKTKVMTSSMTTAITATTDRHVLTQQPSARTSDTPTKQKGLTAIMTTAKTTATAIPDVDTRTVYACEYGTLQLSCLDGETLLVIAANYGRTSTSFSGCGCWITCRTDCRSDNSLAVVRAACQGNQQCRVLAKNDVFGDPCKGLGKYLEVSYRCITETNVALFKAASSSSTPARWGPEKAVDGFRGTSVNRDQCTHTDNVYQPWWKVDLADNYTVNRVSVLNRGDCCGGRLKGFTVRIGLNEDFTRNDQCGETYTAKPPNGATVVVYCDQPMTGRYVSIQLFGRSDNLQLCEVDVFAETARQCPSGWYMYRNHCYKLERNANWQTAKSRCEQFGAHLLSITSADESNFIEGLISDVRKTRVWMGLREKDSRVSGWYWVDGSELTYENWFPGEPNNKSFMDLFATDVHCATIYTKTEGAFEAQL
ncbi:hypothetical protein Bbelb_039560 [Branchiostoma belcheri]|nr:hypothetical protein Bbelb_039560 [Branchiostoma belcheri]